MKCLPRGESNKRGDGINVLINAAEWENWGGGTTSGTTLTPSFSPPVTPTVATDVDSSIT